MSLPVSEVPAEMAPYVTCEYWGIDGVAAVSEIMSLAPVLKKGNRRAIAAKEVLEAALRLGQDGNPAVLLETLAPGDSFNWKDHAPGTVIVFNQETLFRKGTDEHCVDLEEDASAELPEPPTSLQMVAHHEAPLHLSSQQMVGGGLVYQVLTQAGVVVRPAGMSRRHFVTLDGMGVKKPRATELTDLGKGTVKVSRTLSRPRLGPARLTVGETRPQNNKSGTKPRWSRVNALAIVAYGEDLSTT
ncbi:MAG TPA: hypothetical protein VIJ68_01835 [Candidatus Saccharimonadales bacterium]